MKMYNISIHALRVEGDIFHSSIHRAGAISIHALRVEGDRAKLEQIEVLAKISIHALRVEGDKTTSHLSIRQRISIHALRVEGDTCDVRTLELALLDFYPRPPGGGRPS